MGRPTLDDLREADCPGILERERLEYRAPLMRDALVFVADWLDGKPTPQGWIIGHGTREVREVVRKALGT